MRDGFDKNDDEMDYMQAVALAREGKEEGFNFLYKNTYREKYYIAIKYMKNVENAQDVLQDSYIKAFNKLDTLKDANAFPRWIGQIVANTAKNALSKKNLVLFPEMNSDSDNSKNWEDQTEDHNKTYQPEEAYTAKETQAMVHELLESLSDEQRLCMLMFYIEEQSIKDIANAFNCSENTVKSRLNYGRKNLKSQAEILQKKGYKLYSFAPVSLLLYLLHSEKELYVAAENTLAATSLYTKIARNSNIKKVSEEGGKEAVKQTFIHTVAGKITMPVVGVATLFVLAIIGLGIYLGIQSLKPEAQPNEIVKTEDSIKIDSGANTSSTAGSSNTGTDKVLTSVDPTQAETYERPIAEDNATTVDATPNDEPVSEEYVNEGKIEEPIDTPSQTVVTPTPSSDTGGWNGVIEGAIPADSSGSNHADNLFNDK